MTKTKILMMAVSVSLLAGCNLSGEDKYSYRTIEREERICSTESEDKRGSFTLQCIKNANPLSDEEPEDWIGICRRMSTKIYCPLVVKSVDQHKIDNGFWTDDIR